VSRKADAGEPPAAKRRGGNVVVAASMVRPEYAYLNPHLLAERGGPALRVSPEDAAALELADGDDVRLRVDGLWRRATVRVTDAVPAGLLTIAATPDQPQGVVHASGRWYLVAWDLDREDWRTFRIDRIGSRISAGPRFAPREGPDGGDLAAFVSRSVSTDVYSVRARLLLHAPYDALRERISPLAGTLTPIDGDRCELETGAYTLRSLAAWLAAGDIEFDVLDPPELLERLRDMRGRIERTLARAPRRR